VDDQTISPAAAVTIPAEGKSKSKSKKKEKKNGLNRKTGMIESAFIKTLRSIVTPKHEKRGPWPPKNILDDSSKVRDQMTAMFAALFDSLERHDDLRPGPKGSAQRIVFDMLKGSSWPLVDKKFPVPRKWSVDERLLAFRRYEISCAMGIFYRAFNMFGPQGSPTDWPPKN
jgi:hypothetical protein